MQRQKWAVLGLSLLIGDTCETEYFCCFDEIVVAMGSECTYLITEPNKHCVVWAKEAILF